VPATNIAVARRVWPASVAVDACQGTDLAPAVVEALIRKEANAAKVDARFATLIARDESQYGAVGISEKGALGVMQLMPGTAERYKVVNPCDPAENVRGGVAFLADLFREFGHPMLVAAAYNAGPSAVYEAKGVPRFPETIRYVASVSNDYFGFSNRLARRGRGGPTPQAQTNVITTAGVIDGATPTAPKRPELNWIGGHVLNLD
jgi:soluble lytic murein transglycosylase-like protein